MKKAYIVFALICLCNVIALWPSLNHMPRGDQIGYLASVANHDDWLSLIVRTIGLNRGENLTAGDTWLFRPLLYVFLGTERFFFGYDFQSWQLIGIILHLLFLWSFWRLLVTIKESWLALLVTAFFSFTPVLIDLVVWQHVNAYLLALILMFQAARYAILFLQDKISFKKMIMINGLLLTLACLFCEFAVIFTFAIFILLCQANNKDTQGIWPKVLLLLPIGIFLTFNIYHWLSIYQIQHAGVGGYQIKGDFVWRGVVSFPVVFLRWLGLAAFPFTADFKFFEERFIAHAAKGFNPLTLINGLIVIKGLSLCKDIPQRFKNKTVDRQIFLFFITVTLMLCFIFSLMRVGPRGMGYFKQALYWSYFYWAFLLTAFYTCLPLKRMGALREWSWWNKCVLISMIILIIAYGINNYFILEKKALEDAPAKKLIAAIEYQRCHKVLEETDMALFKSDPGNRQYSFGNGSLFDMLYTGAFLTSQRYCR